MNHQEVSPLCTQNHVQATLQSVYAVNNAIIPVFVQGICKSC